MERLLSIITVIAIALLSATTGYASKAVTVDNFVRAETDMTLDRYLKQGGFGKFLHLRQPTPIDKQDVIRMNLDTLYSIGVFDLTQPVTIVKPDSAVTLPIRTICRSRRAGTISSACISRGKWFWVDPGRFPRLSPQRSSRGLRQV